MQIFVDADACPVVRIVEEIAEKYNKTTETSEPELLEAAES